MNAWQLAVLVNGHNLPKCKSFFLGRASVRPTIIRESDENSNPCWPNGNWYEVLTPDGSRFIVCEHEILTD